MLKNFENSEDALLLTLAACTDDRDQLTFDEIVNQKSKKRGNIVFVKRGIFYCFFTRIELSFYIERYRNFICNSNSQCSRFLDDNELYMEKELVPLFQTSTRNTHADIFSIINNNEAFFGEQT